MWISVVTAQELIRWHFEEVESSFSAPRKQVLDAYYYFWDILAVIHRFHVAQFETTAYDNYLGMPGHVDVSDRRIAATALALGLTVVTHNETDFLAIKAVKPQLQFQNWVTTDHT